MRSIIGLRPIISLIGATLVATACTSCAGQVGDAVVAAASRASRTAHPPSNPSRGPGEPAGASKASASTSPQATATGGMTMHLDSSGRYGVRSPADWRPRAGADGLTMWINTANDEGVAVRVMKDTPDDPFIFSATGMFDSGWKCPNPKFTEASRIMRCDQPATLRQKGKPPICIESRAERRHGLLALIISQARGTCAERADFLDAIRASGHWVQ